MLSSFSAIRKAIEIKKNPIGDGNYTYYTSDYCGDGIEIKKNPIGDGYVVLVILLLL